MYCTCALYIYAHQLFVQELCLKSYSTQLAHIHIEYYLHQLLQSVPGLSTLPPNSPVTGMLLHARVVLSTLPNT